MLSIASRSCPWMLDVISSGMRATAEFLADPCPVAVAWTLSNSVMVGKHQTCFRDKKGHQPEYLQSTIISFSVWHCHIMWQCDFLFLEISTRTWGYLLEKPWKTQHVSPPQFTSQRLALSSIVLLPTTAARWHHLRNLTTPKSGKGWKVCNHKETTK